MQSDTPIKHNELSITRTSLRSRVLITANNQKNLRKKLPVIESKALVDKSENNSGSLTLNEISSTKPKSTTSVDDKENFEMLNIVSKDERRNGHRKNQLANPFTLLCETNESCCKNDFSQEQKQSTPRVSKEKTKAVSSTPNLEIVNVVNRLIRNVSTQTNFTLNARDPDEFDEHLRSCCIEDPEERISYEMSCSPLLSTDLSLPRHECTSRFMNCDISNTPTQNKSLVRKLSLRSKTMICSAIEKSKDNPNVLVRHKSVEEKRLFSNTFSVLPQQKTPPSLTGKVLHNPFETDLPERLGKTIFSPDVFENVVSPSEDSEYLRWTIEDISSINPVPIEEDFTLPSDDEDPERESVVQQEIERYFSETHVVLSPFDDPKNMSAIKIKEINTQPGAVASTPQKPKTKLSKDLKTSGTQTALTLPENLPEELEHSLRIYFRLFEKEDFNLSASNLRRKLFFHSEDEPPSPVRFEIYSSPITKDLQKTETSPFAVLNNRRHFSPHSRQHELSSPEMSPVVADCHHSKFRNDSFSACKKTLHLYFSGDTRKHPENRDMVNSTVIPMDISSTSTLPSSQDTGYQTEDSWQTSQKVAVSSPPRPILHS